MLADRKRESLDSEEQVSLREEFCKVNYRKHRVLRYVCLKVPDIRSFTRCLESQIKIFLN